MLGTGHFVVVVVVRRRTQFGGEVGQPDCSVVSITSWNLSLVAGGAKSYIRQHEEEKGVCGVNSQIQLGSDLRRRYSSCMVYFCKCSSIEGS